MSAAHLVRTARAAAGLTQAELAARAGLQQPVIARLERGGANPTLATLERVMLATGHRLTAAPVASGVDETQIIERLRLTPAQRLAAFGTSQRNVTSLKRNARRLRRG